MTKSLPAQNFNHKYLRYTNLLLIIPLFYFLLNKEKTMIDFLLLSLVVLNIIFYQLFWNNPIRNSKIHKIDAIIAKIVILSFIIYTLIYKLKFSYLFVLSGMSISFYFSNKFSNIEWCCNKHLLWHGFLHIFGFIGMFYAFL
jgi:hypothetical protein